jgi:rubrerythrin
VDIIEALKKAMEEEEKSREFYLRCAEEAQDPESRAVFETMARDEEAHRRILKERIMALKLRREKTQ